MSTLSESDRGAHSRLIEAERLLRRAEAVSGVGGFMQDFAGGDLHWTPQAYRIHDLETTSAVTSAVFDGLLAPDARARLAAATRRAREEGTGYDLELPVVTRKNRSIWIRMTAEVECEGGVPRRLYGSIQDVTERRGLEQRLRDALAAADKASRSKSEFLANMSHEIRTPLNAVIGLGYLLEQTPLTEEQRQFLAKIQFAGRALLGVINNVLDLSKIEADEMALEDEPFDLSELVRDVSQMLMPQAQEKGIEVNVRPAASLPRRVVGDAARVRQILTNLLNNAIKFTERGAVRLAVFCTGQSAGRVRVRCEVEDTGIGIEKAACERLFTPFTQADATTTRRFGGTGLGLSIARRFVELMGGEIGVESTVGTGSTFWIEIPLKLAPEVNGAIASALKVLILDPRGDEPEGLGAMVRALGWIPLVAKSGDQMSRLMAAGSAVVRPDALILDLQERDFEAGTMIAELERLRPTGESPPVIVVAGSPQSSLECKQCLRETDVLLVRPVSSSALFNAINLAVSRRADGGDKVFESTNFDELQARWLCGVTVLVVDDSHINLEVAQRILTNQGARVSTCSDGAAALERLRVNQDMDIVLMDVQMPVLDGNEAARRIRTELKLRLPIVALTAGALVGERQRALDAGMDDFVSKPFDPQVLIRKVRRLVELERGEPIPMVFGTADSAGPAARAPFPKSIDAGVVQQVFGEDLALFGSLLGRMLAEYADFALPLAAPEADETARIRLAGRAHKLKGSAGMIGATNIMRLAGAAERALRESRPSGSVEGILKKLAVALITLREEAEQFPVRAGALQPPDGSAGGPVRIEPSDVEELCVLLESQNLAAVDKFEQLAASLRGILDPGRFQGLIDAVENLDFQNAAELLRGALRERVATAA